MNGGAESDLFVFSDGDDKIREFNEDNGQSTLAVEPGATVSATRRVLT